MRCPFCFTRCHWVQPLHSLGGPLAQVGSSWGAHRAQGPGAPRRASGPWTRGRGCRAAGPLWRWGSRLCVPPLPAGLPPSAKITPAAAPYLALCHQLPKNSENQIYFPISAARPLCSELPLTVVTPGGQCEGLYGAKKSRRWAALAPAVRPLLGLPSRCGNSPGKFFSQ